MKRAGLTIAVLLIAYTGFGQGTSLKIGVDERVELITALQLISKSSVITLSNADIAYAKEVTDKFGKYVNHPAVVSFDSVYNRYFNFEMPFQLILHYSLPGFKVIAPLSATEFSPTRQYNKNADSLAL